MRSLSPLGIIFYTSLAIERFKEHPDTMVSHGATQTSEGGRYYAGFFWCLASADFKARFRRGPVCHHRALWDVILHPFSYPVP